jgi:uncharacterized protein
VGPREDCARDSGGLACPPVVVEPVLRTFTYAVLALGAAAVAAMLGHDPLTTRSVLGLSGAFALAMSLVMGALFAGVTIATTRVMLRTQMWARALHADLRPAVRHASGRGIVGMALASGIAEELVFRGLLVPVVGVVVSSVAFGLLHQVRGQARWAWVAWAGITGFLLAGIFVLTGSLAGPVLAHVAINLVNLRHLRDTDLGGGVPVARPRARLGGVLTARGETARPTASARAHASPSARRA